MQSTTALVSSPAGVRLVVGERLDLSAHAAFSAACEALSRPGHGELVIDLTHTRSCLDSGLGVLMMLPEVLGGDRAIRVVNTSPAVRAQLVRVPMPGGLAIEQ